MPMEPPVQLGPTICKVRLAYDICRKESGHVCTFGGFEGCLPENFCIFELPRIDLLQFQHYFHSFQTQRDVSKRPVSISSELPKALLEILKNP